jgi:ABC-type Fe3+-hydroxamate transport system substrate-binding protein
MGICAVSMRTILIQKGYFVGHKYRFDGGYAIRLAGKNAIEIYDDDGKMLKTVSLEEIEKKDAA